MRQLRQAVTRRAVLIRTLSVHRLVLVLVVFGAVLSGFNEEQFRTAYARWPQNGGPTFGSHFATWDAAHYLRLSSIGYQHGSFSCAFYPLWPLTIRAVSILSSFPILPASLLLANGLAVAAFWMLFKLIERKFDVKTAQCALILVLAFPGSLFFSFPYTESLYLFLVVAFFSELERERYFWPCLIGLLMPLTKAIGVFIVLPLAWHLYEKRRTYRHWLLLLAPLLGWAAYFGYMYTQTGNAFEGFEAQKAYPHSPSIRNMFNLPAFFNAFVMVGSVHGMMDSVLDRLYFVLFLSLLPLIYRLNRTWFWYALPAGLIPAMTSYFMSYRRYIMVLFPLFIVLAQLLTKDQRRWLFWYYVAASIALQAWAIREFVSFDWSG